jgi:hypothetical protein
MQTLKEKLLLCSFPRSGNVYLNEALHLLYFPEDKSNHPNHFTYTIKERNKTLVAFRNPIDSIASWVSFPIGNDLDGSIKFYTRFYNVVLENIDKCVLMDFDLFIKDIDYIKNKVFANFNIDTNNQVTDFQIKKSIINKEKEINLPRNNKEELDEIKKQLNNSVEFSKFTDLYNNLKSKSN